MGALYRLDFPNGKSYIGITSGTVEGRFREHVEMSQRPKRWAVHRAIAKYGADSVKCVTLAISNSWAYLCHIEQRAIEVFGTYKTNGYNLTKGGDGFRGNHTPEAKAKIGRAARNISPETRERIGAAFRGKEGSNKGAKHSAKACADKSLRQLAKSAIGHRNTSGYVGVYWHKAAGKWQAYFKVDGKVRYLGLFDNKETAADARKIAVDRHLSEMVR